MSIPNTINRMCIPVETVASHLIETSIWDSTKTSANASVSSVRNVTEFFVVWPHWANIWDCVWCLYMPHELNQLREHKIFHTKRKAVSNSEYILKKKRNNREMFYCRVCLQSSMNREELFYHKLEHMADSTAYHLVEPHFDFEDERVNALLCENADLIFTGHRFTQISSDFNFPCILSLNCDGWITEMYQALYLVANENNQESFKINFMGFILMNRQTGRHRFFAPHENTAFFKKPIRIDRPASWRELYSQLNEESLKAYITHHGEDTKWIPVMLTNSMIRLYFLGVPMGLGELPQYIKENRSIAGWDKDRHNSTLYEDKLCGLKCVGLDLNLKDVGDGYKGLEIQDPTTLSTMGKKECRLDGNAAIWRAIQYQCGHLFTVWRWSCCITLFQWRIVSGQDGSELAWHSSQLCN